MEFHLADPKVRIGLAVGFLALLSLWAFSEVFVPPASRACMALYRSARTAADTQHVDATIPYGAGGKSHEARSCGAIRETARWF